MAIKKYKPVTPGLRTKITVDYSDLTVDRPHKSLTKGKSKSGGRNHVGKMTMRQLGGGAKRKYRVIDFKRDKEGIPGKVATLEYDPNRTAFIALINYADGEKRYIIAPHQIKVGDVIMSGEKATPDTGNAMYFSAIPLGTDVFNIEMVPGKGAALARSAGSYATMMGREGKYAIIKLPSGEVRKVLLTCKAVIGRASNPDHSHEVLGKAGRTRWMGKRSRVRGVAMNPVDHPMGGGEGRASGGHPRSRTGIMAKGEKTRNVKKASTKLIISKRK
ncbi:MAG: 50S ribosomal protein L2 [Saprospiraceae bacterium]|nr:MAG: 50S ribosomal protein L2 [Bacteroidetes bacterium OLB9]MCO6464466.1 50S ribosomal protein L2 [Saprospiraceae bacterium]